MYLTGKLLSCIDFTKNIAGTGNALSVFTTSGASTVFQGVCKETRESSQAGEKNQRRKKTAETASVGMAVALWETITHEDRCQQTQTRDGRVERRLPVFLQKNF